MSGGSSSGNVLIGGNAGNSITSGASSICIGSFSGSNSNTPYNVFIGNSSGILQTNTSNGRNTLIGNFSDVGNSQNCVAVGYSAGADTTYTYIGDNNISLGYEAKPYSITASNHAQIGNSDIMTFQLGNSLFDYNLTSSGIMTISGGLKLSNFKNIFNVNPSSNNSYLVSDTLGNLSWLAPTNNINYNFSCDYCQYGALDSGYTFGTNTINFTTSQTIDGYETAIGDNILYFDNSNPSNWKYAGLYTVTNRALGMLEIWTRSTKLNNVSQFAQGQNFYINKGARMGGQTLKFSNKTVTTLNNDPLVYVSSIVPIPYNLSRLSSPYSQTQLYTTIDTTFTSNKLILYTSNFNYSSIKFILTRIDMTGGDPSQPFVASIGWNSPNYNNILSSTTITPSATNNLNFPISGVNTIFSQSTNPNLIVNVTSPSGTQSNQVVFIVSGYWIQ